MDSSFGGWRDMLHLDLVHTLSFFTMLMNVELNEKAPL